MLSRGKNGHEAVGGTTSHDIEQTDSTAQRNSPSNNEKHLPRYNHMGHKVTRGIKPEGESGRSGIHPWHFLRICFRSTSTLSMIVNLLWPFVPAAIAMRYARKDFHVAVFALNYIAMVPTANLVGFAGQELARKIPKVMGVILETFLGGIVEIVLFMVLLHNNDAHDNLIPVIRSAILGSILANLLLCLGACFFFGGLGRNEQDFDPAISEVGNGLLLVAGFGLLIPAAFFTSLSGNVEALVLKEKVITISRVTSVILLVAFLIYVYFQLMTHEGIYNSVLEMDEERDRDRHIDLVKDKLTLVESLVALVIALTCVSLHAIFLVEEIEFIVERGVSDAFLGLILVPIVEKAAEHLTAVDEAWDNQMNFAVAHVLGSTIQTALFNSALVVIVGWGLKKNMDLNFEIFNAVVLILAILVVGNFIRDGKSNYLEGSLCILVYMIIAITAFYYPNPKKGETNTASGGATGGGGALATPAGETITAAAEATTTAVVRLIRG